MVQSVSLQAGSEETLPTSPLFSSSQTSVTPGTSVFEVQSQHCTATPSLLSSSSSSTKQSEVASQHKTAADSPVATQSPTSQCPSPTIIHLKSLIQSLPSALAEAPPLVCSAQLPSQSPAKKPPSLPPAPSLAASCMGPQSAPLPRTAVSSASQPSSPQSQRPSSPASVRSSMETPAAEALVQMPRQDPPPLQTATEDLQAHLAAPCELLKVSHPPARSRAAPSANVELKVMVSYLPLLCFWER